MSVLSLGVSVFWKLSHAKKHNQQWCTQFWPVACKHTLNELLPVSASDTHVHPHACLHVGVYIETHFHNTLTPGQNWSSEEGRQQTSDLLTLTGIAQPTCSPPMLSPMKDTQ